MKIRYKTLKDLEKYKEKHTKVKHLIHSVLKMQNYLTANACKMKQEDSQLIFKLRSRMTEVKMNMKGLYFNERWRKLNPRTYTPMQSNIKYAQTMTK